MTRIAGSPPHSPESPGSQAQTASSAAQTPPDLPLRPPRSPRLRHTMTTEQVLRSIPMEAGLTACLIAGVHELRALLRGHCMARRATGNNARDAAAGARPSFPGQFGANAAGTPRHIGIFATGGCTYTCDAAQDAAEAYIASLFSDSSSAAPALAPGSAPVVPVPTMESEAAADTGLPMRHLTIAAVGVAPAALATAQTTTDATPPQTSAGPAMVTVATLPPLVPMSAADAAASASGSGASSVADGLVVRTTARADAFHTAE